MAWLRVLVISLLRTISLPDIYTQSAGAGDPCAVGVYIHTCIRQANCAHIIAIAYNYLV